jgi:hypothetical protein
MFAFVLPANARRGDLWKTRMLRANEYVTPLCQPWQLEANWRLGGKTPAMTFARSESIRRRPRDTLASPSAALIHRFTSSSHLMVHFDPDVGSPHTYVIYQFRFASLLRQVHVADGHQYSYAYNCQLLSAAMAAHILYIMLRFERRMSLLYREIYFFIPLVRVSDDVWFVSINPPSSRASRAAWLICLNRSAPSNVPPKYLVTTTSTSLTSFMRHSSGTISQNKE